MRKNTARRGINKKVRRLREMVKAEDAYERVRQYGSLSSLIAERKGEEGEFVGMWGNYYKHPRIADRTPRRRASRMYRMQVIHPAADAYRKMKPKWHYSLMYTDSDYLDLLAEIEESKPHLWPQFLAEYRESLGLPPLRKNTGSDWYSVKLERSRGRKKTYEALNDEYLSDAEFNDLNGAFEAMVEFVTLNLGHLADARVVEDKTRSRVKAYIDLGHLNGEDLRIVVMPASRSNPGHCPISGKYVPRSNPKAAVVLSPEGEEVRFCCPSHKKRYLRENPGSVDLKGRRIPEKYLAGLSAKERKQRIAELTEQRDRKGVGDKRYKELASDRLARKKGLVKQSAYSQVAEKRGIQIRYKGAQPDFQATARAALRYYKAKGDVDEIADLLEQSYDKGLAAWQSGGHRPGASQRNWGDARVHSLLVGGKTAWYPSADRKQVRQFPRKMQEGIIRQMPEVFKALKAQGRQKDITYLRPKYNAAQEKL